MKCNWKFVHGSFGEHKTLSRRHLQQSSSWRNLDNSVRSAKIRAQKKIAINRNAFHCVQTRAKFSNFYVHIFYFHRYPSPRLCTLAKSCCKEFGFRDKKPRKLFNVTSRQSYSDISIKSMAREKEFAVTPRKRLQYQNNLFISHQSPSFEWNFYHVNQIKVLLFEFAAFSFREISLKVEIHFRQWSWIFQKHIFALRRLQEILLRETKGTKLCKTFFRWKFALLLRCIRDVPKPSMKQSNGILFANVRES